MKKFFAAALVVSMLTVLLSGCMCQVADTTFQFDGSGTVTRGTYLQDGKKKYNHSMCVFANGKQYHCDLNASYNIGARYLVREIIKSLPETVRLDMEAKVPSCTKRSTCTLSTLIHLNAELTA